MRRGGAAATVEGEIVAARVCLEGGDMDGYEAKMRAAVELDRETREQQGRTIALTGGVILDVSMLRAGAGIFNISNSSSPRDASDVGTAREIRDEVGKAGRAVCGLLDMTIEMCAASEVVLQDWRAAGGGRGGAKAPKTLNLDGALSACRAARGHAAAANNAFVRANHLATLTAWILKRRADIARRLQSEIAGLRSAVARLRDIPGPRAVRWSFAYLLAWLVSLLDAPFVWPFANSWLSIGPGRPWCRRSASASATSTCSSTRCRCSWLRCLTSSSKKAWRRLTGPPSPGTPRRCAPSLPPRASRPRPAALCCAVARSCTPSWPTIRSSSSSPPSSRTRRSRVPSPPRPAKLAACKWPSAPRYSFSDPDDLSFDAAHTLVTTPLLAGLFASYGEEDADSDSDDNSDLDDSDPGPARPSIQDVAAELRLRFADAGAQQLQTLTLLQAMGALQKLRVKYLAAGSQPLAQVIRNTLRLNDSALAAAGTAYDYYLDQVRTWFTDLVATLDTTLDDLVDEIAQLDENIEELQEQQRKNVISLVAKLVALAFTLSGAIVSLSALSPRKFTKVSFKVAKKSAKAALEAVSIREVRESILLLKHARAELRIQAKTLERVLPQVTGVEIQLGGFKGVLGAMGERLDYVAANIHQFDWLQLTQADVDEVHAAWDEAIEGANQVAAEFYTAGVI